VFCLAGYKCERICPHGSLLNALALYSDYIQIIAGANVTLIMASEPYKFEGWMGLDKESVDGKMVWSEFQPKAWEETDVDIRVSHCGICGSDLHTLRSGWVRYSLL